MKAAKITTILLTTLLLSSCIKENRENCPSWLILDLTEIDTTLVENLALFIVSEENKICNEIYLEKENIKDHIELEVEKRSYSIFGWGNISEKSILNTQEQSIEITAGKDADPLYFHKSHIKTTGEKHREKIFPDKNYINIQIFLEGNIKNEDREIFLESETAGYLLNGEKIDRKIEIPAPYQEFCSANIIRQFDYKNLNLLIINDYEGFRIPIGELIMKDPPAGFPEKLSDITLRIDFSESRITIKIGGWKKVFENFCKIF